MKVLSRFAALLALTCAGATVLAAGVSAHATGPTGVSFGVAEDASKYAPDAGKTVYASLKTLGMTENRWTLTFTGDPSAITEAAFLDKAVPAAAASNTDIILSLFPASAQIPDPNSFCQWVGNVASRYQSVTKFIIGNEVNATRFWSPQHTSSDANTGPDTYEATLAQCYDVLKAVNPSIQVIGMGLAPRSVDSNSTKPLDFIRAVGAAYKASGRTTPIMDAIAVHPYPNPNASPPPAPDQATYQDSGFYGITQLDRVRQAVYDAFNGSGQPTTLNGLKLVVDEIGYQSNETGNPQYTGTESSPTVSETQQAAYYARIVQLYACDPTISAVLFFHLIDEANLNITASSGGWQSGLEYPDGTPKPSYAAVQQAITAGCTGAPATWTPVTTTPPTRTPPPSHGHGSGSGSGFGSGRLICFRLGDHHHHHHHHVCILPRGFGHGFGDGHGSGSGLGSSHDHGDGDGDGSGYGSGSSSGIGSGSFSGSSSGGSFGNSNGYGSHRDD